MDGQSGYIVVTLRVSREDEQYVAECVELGVASCGDTLDQAFAAIKDAVQVYLETLAEVGERERVLAERGIPIQLGQPPSPGAEIRLHARPDEYVTPELVRLPISA